MPLRRRVRQAREGARSKIVSRARDHRSSASYAGPRSSGSFPIVAARYVREALHRGESDSGWVRSSAATRVGVARRMADLLDLVPDRANATPQRAVPARGEQRGRVRDAPGLRDGERPSATRTPRRLAFSRATASRSSPRSTRPAAAVARDDAGERELARDLARAQHRRVRAGRRRRRGRERRPGAALPMKEYGWLLKDDPKWSARASAFAAKVRDATEFLGDLGITERRGTFGGR